MAGWDEKPRIVDVDMRVEVEEREEQLYEDDGKTPVTKTQPDGTVAAGKKTRVKLKRYFYRLAVTVTMNATVADGPSKIGSDIGKRKNPSGFQIDGDTGVKYLCSGERVTLLNASTDAWKLTQTWNGFGPWKKVPKNWDMDQTSEEVPDGAPGDGGGGNNNNSNNNNT